jgi:hypothetical protein
VLGQAVGGDANSVRNGSYWQTVVVNFQHLIEPMWCGAL